MFVTPDFSEAVEFDNTPITGVYKGRVTNVELKTSKAGNPYLNWEFSLFGAEGEAAKHNNRKVFHMTMTTGAGAGKLKDILKALDLPLTGFSTEQALGKEAVLTLAQRQDNEGNARQDVKAVKAIQH